MAPNTCELFREVTLKEQEKEPCEKPASWDYWWLISSVENTRVHIIWNKDATERKKGHTGKPLPRTNLTGLINTWLAKPPAV